MFAAILLGLFVSPCLQDDPSDPGPSPEKTLLKSGGATVELPPSAQGEPEAAPASESQSGTEGRILAPNRNEPVRVPPRPGETLPGAGTIVFWTLFVLALLGTAAFLLRRFVHKAKFLGAGAIRVLARKPISPKQQVFLVEAGPKVFLVGATKDHLSTLGEFSKPDDVAAVRASSPVYNDDSVRESFRKSLNDGITDAETKPAGEETYDNIVDELQGIRKTVLSWKA